MNKIFDILGGYKHDECFALEAIDEGFFPYILPKDVVIIHKQPMVENGELAAVVIDDDTNAVLRRVWCDDKRITLTVDNHLSTKQCEPIDINADEQYRMRCFGKVIAVGRNCSLYNQY